MRTEPSLRLSRLAAIEHGSFQLGFLAMLEHDVKNAGSAKRKSSAFHPGKVAKVVARKVPGGYVTSGDVALEVDDALVGDDDEASAGEVVAAELIGAVGAVINTGELQAAKLTAIITLETGRLTRLKNRLNICLYSIEDTLCGY
ncbi:hypothetical protein [Glaciimonas soli]|uniref:hypothetical protein n=1 Tax=Glaciimonas soli TaxID=2590999 RepID=UPI001D176D42